MRCAFPTRHFPLRQICPYSDLSKLYQQNIRREAYTTHIGGWQVVWKLVGEDNDKKLQPVAVRVGITDYSDAIAGEICRKMMRW